MAGPIVTTSVATTGGAIILNITLGNPALDVNSALITIKRYANSLSATPITILNNGLYTPVYFDVGDGLETYLNFTTPYYYTVTDPTGTTTVGPITPAAQILVYSNYLDGMLFKLFSAGISAVAVPAQFNKINVLQALPLTMGSDGTIFPFIVMNLDLEQQEYLEIGENVESNIKSPLNTLPVVVTRIYSINVLSQNAQERDFYKDACLGVCFTLINSLLDIGQGFTYDIQASNTQATQSPQVPGFYCSTIMFEFTGQFNVTINDNLPRIEIIAPIISTTPSPLSSPILVEASIH